MRWSLTVLVVVLAVARADAARIAYGRLGITAADLRAHAAGQPAATDKLAKLPVSQRNALALQLLGERDLSCPNTADSCGFEEAQAPAARATHRTPCFRRWLLLATLASLYPDGSLALTPAIRRAMVRHDESVLIAVDVALSDMETVELAHVFATAGRPFTLRMLDDAQAVTRAVDVYALEDGLSSLRPETHATSMQRAVTDARFSPESRARVLASLMGALPATQLAALASPLLRDPSCTLAGTAARAVAQSDPSAMPMRPATRDPATFLRGMCMMSAGWGPGWHGVGSEIAASYVPDGLRVTYPEGRPYTSSTAAIVETVRAETLVEHPLSEGETMVNPAMQVLSLLGQPRCTGLVCRDGLTSLTLEHDAAGDLVLRNVVIARDLANENRASCE